MKYKVITICYVFFVILLSSSCGLEQDNNLMDTVSVQLSSAENNVIRDEEYLPSQEYGLNPEKAAIKYEGKVFRKSVFAAGGDTLYIYGIKEDGAKFLGYMKEEESVFREFALDLDENMRAFNMAVDREGRCHILWMSVEERMIDGNRFDEITYENSYITVVDEGTKVSEQNVSDIFDGEIKRPHCWVADGQGNYYFENGQEIIELSAENEVRHIACSGYVEGIGIGKSGQLYATYENEMGESILEKPEGQNVMTEQDKLILPDSDSIYMYMMPGSDSELILYSKANGVYAYHDMENRVNLNLPGKELPVSGEACCGWGLLRDGRICLMSVEAGDIFFYYIPTGG